MTDEPDGFAAWGDGFLAYLAVRRAADPELKKALRGLG